jgi:DNA-binding transcriptional ArsR family regulator
MAELLLRRNGTTSSPPADQGAGTNPHGLDRVGRALADPIRRSILMSLLGGTRRPSELAEEIGTSRSNLSNHLSCLRGCGLISATRAGRHLHYDLVSTHFADALLMLVEIAATLPSCDQPDTNQGVQ